MTNADTSTNPSDGKSRAESTSSGNSRNTFKKKERLCSKRAFDLIFAKRRSFNVGGLWVAYTLDLPSEHAAFPMMVAFAVPKRSFKKAPDRNLLKRRMREAYRLNKHRTLKKYTEKGKNVAFLMKYNPKEIRSFKEIERDMRRALRRLSELI